MWLISVLFLNTAYEYQLSQNEKFNFKKKIK